ncbi:hypothetical protein, partial [Arcobacter sp.]|uniref:hypothetical protein n=1 Tax=Arcobacter sp. TaxID=1872629 RepID=UPI003D0FD481
QFIAMAASSSPAVVWHSAAFSIALSYNQKMAFRTFLFFYFCAIFMRTIQMKCIASGFFFPVY